MKHVACLTIETSGHLFWESPKAREVWTTTGIPFDTQGVYDRDFVDFIWYLMFMQLAGHNLLELIFSVAWCMWHNRNKARLGSTDLGPPDRPAKRLFTKQGQSLKNSSWLISLGLASKKKKNTLKISGYLHYIHGTKSTPMPPYFHTSRLSGSAS